MRVMDQLGDGGSPLGPGIQMIFQDQSQLVPHPLLPNPGGQNKLSLKQFVDNLNMIAQLILRLVDAMAHWPTSCTFCESSQGSTSMTGMEERP